MDIAFLSNGPEEAKHTVLLAHGAGGPMDSPALAAVTEALAAAGFRVYRFEFGYMAKRRTEAVRKPPPRADKLLAEYIAAVDAVAAGRKLIIAGKSMGGRVASMVADQLYAENRVSGLLCLGYPFHPPAKPDQLRTNHLVDLKTPTLIVQGTRDPFGTRAEVNTYVLSSAIDFLWLEDGDHDLRPRKKISGFSAADHLQTLAKAAWDWAEGSTRDFSRR